MGVMTQPYTGSLPPKYGTGIDGDLTVTSGAVTIQAIYENDTVSGVTTKRGVGKGLNYGSGTYNKDTNKIPNFKDVTIDAGCTLTGIPYSSAAAREGNVCFLAIGDVVINGTLSAASIGYQGGAAAYTVGFDNFYAPTDGAGPGHGHAPGSDYLPELTPPGAAGATYGDNATLAMGSGGGGANYPGATTPGVQSGGSGGGAMQILARRFIFGASGTIIATGQTAPWNTNARMGMGGSGSGGHIILTSFWTSHNGTNKITALGGAAINATQSGAMNASAGSAGYSTAGTEGADDKNAVKAGGAGRIRLYGTWTGTTNPTAA